ncbi:hypothetical protein [Clostridium ihumii]|uniref:hypothetical protein n=1 Tax=Clostridium ihumii TaxID=1470356 RepID=UPI00058C7FAA|nr:hypothetical protein [Clostridium ihumii]
MRKIITFGIILFIVLINTFQFKESVASENLDIYKEILKISSAKIEEVGIESTFINDESLQSCYNNLKKAFQFNNPINNEKIVSSTTDYLQFDIDNINGNIQRIDANKIKISINQKTDKNNTELLKSILRNAFNDNTSQYLYIKSKINDDYHEINDKILKFLDKSGATDINTVNLNNGYSTICNTHKYNVKNIANGSFDFQVAIMNYNSESEIIIGIPEITVAF